MITNVLVSCSLVGNILVNPSILHSTLWVKSTQHALMSSVIFTPQSGLNWNLVAGLGRFVPFKVTANLFPLSDKWSCKPFPVPFPCAFLINTAWHSVLIFASVCRQVATFNSRGRKTKHPHNQLSKQNLGQPSEIQFRNTLSSNMTSRFATENHLFTSQWVRAKVFVFSLCARQEALSTQKYRTNTTHALFIS